MPESKMRTEVPKCFRLFQPTTHWIDNAKMSPILFKANTDIGEFLDISGLKTAQRDIVENWVGNEYIFSVSQIAQRNKIKRGQARRQIYQLIKMGIVSVWYDPGKNRKDI